TNAKNSVSAAGPPFSGRLDVSTRTCSSCRSVISANHKFCPECGAQLKAPAPTPPAATTPAFSSCARCGEPLEPGDQWCPNCLAPREAQTATVASASAGKTSTAVEKT